jgi:hypothetical protein
VIETPERTFTLLRWVWSLYDRNAILDAADERLRGNEANDWWIERVLVVGLWCALPERSERPSVTQAMHILQSEEAKLPALPLHMYRTVNDTASSTGPYGDTSSGVRSSSINTGDPSLSSMDVTN